MDKLIIDNISIRFAKDEDLENIKSFFGLHLFKDNKAIYNEEFLCPFGLKHAVIKKNVIIAVSGNGIVGALRFYSNKRNKITSLYQFAIESKFRRIGLLKKMLGLLKNTEFIVKCPKGLNFNDYFLKTGWKLIGSDDNLNIYSQII